MKNMSKKIYMREFRRIQNSWDLCQRSVGYHRSESESYQVVSLMIKWGWLEVTKTKPGYVWVKPSEKALNMRIV